MIVCVLQYHCFQAIVMSVRKKIAETEGVYFVTFTCYRWLPLIEIVNGYDIVYQQFDYLKSCGHYIIGYVILPNHLHAVIAFRNMGKLINKIIGDVKRFMAYEIVKWLKKLGKKRLLSELAAGVNATDRKRGKLHEVFEASFDAKKIDSDKFMDQKLFYMHTNPCRGRWRLAIHPDDYVHSSAKYYSTGHQGVYKVLHYMELEDIDLTVPIVPAESPTGDSAET